VKAFKNERGTYTARFRDSSGRQREKTFKLKKDAEAYGYRAEADRARGVRVDPQAGRITLTRYVDHWMAAQPHRPATVDLYQRHLRNHILPVMGSRQLLTIQTSEVQGWVKGLTEKGLAPSTVHTIHGIFASIMRSAVRDDRLHKTPCAGVRLPVVPKTDITILEPDEVMALADTITPRYRALIVVAAGTGLRQGEAFGLTMDSIHWLERTVVVDKQVTMVSGDGLGPRFGPPKTAASHRTIPLATHVLDALSLHLQEFEPAGDVLFTNRPGRLIRRSAFNEAVLKPALERADLPVSMTFHDLRHTFASLVIRAGATAKEVQTWMGHATINETFDTYGHLFPSAADNARRFIDDAFTVPGYLSDVSLR
jgi:integrase